MPLIKAVQWSPVVPITLLIDGVDRTVQLKLEGANPGRSVKDRTAGALLDNLEQRGCLERDSIVVESTSGNLGVALARLVQARGLEFLAVVDPKTTPENVARMRQLGASVQVVTTADDKGGYLMTRLALVRELCASSTRYVWTNQYANPANPRAHYRTTAPEIYAQLGGRVDAVFVPVSTGGTLAGLSRYFRKTSPTTAMIAVDARGSVIFGGSPGPRLLTGIGSSRPSSFLAPQMYDVSMQVSDAEAFAFCRALFAATGIKVGGSSGAVLAACARYCATNPELERVVCVCADGGQSYDTSIYDDSWLAQHGLRVSAADLGPVERINVAPPVSLPGAGRIQPHRLPSRAGRNAA
jgi:2,3-diaminopropionate biosynthesis protein SbnA